MTVMTDPTTTSYELGPWNLSEILPEPSETVISTRLRISNALVATFEGCRASLHLAMSREDLVAVMRQGMTS